MEHSWLGSCLTGNGLVIGSNFRGEIIARTTRIMGNWQQGVVLNAGPVAVDISNNHILSNSQSAAGAFAGVAIGAGAQRFRVSGNTIGPAIGLCRRIPMASSSPALTTISWSKAMCALAT